MHDKLNEKRKAKQLSQGIQIKTIKPMVPVRPKKVEIDYQQTFVVKLKVDPGNLMEEKKKKKVVDEIPKDE